MKAKHYTYRFLLLFNNNNDACTFRIPEKRDPFTAHPDILKQGLPLEHVECIVFVGVEGRSDLLQRLLLVSHRVQDVLELVRQHLLLDFQFYDVWNEGGSLKYFFCR